MINRKIAIVFALIHWMILWWCFGIAFAEGTRGIDSASLKISEEIVKTLAWPILAPAFLLTKELSLTTILASVANSALWGVAVSIVISSMKRTADERAD